MKILLQFWRRIPRMVRIVINTLGIFACLLALYTYLDAPVFSVITQFRRYEQAHMVGPSQILGDIPLEQGFDSYSRMIIAQDEEGITFFCYAHAEGDDPSLIYRKKTGDLTVIGAPYPTESRSKTIKCQYPIFVFDTYPNTVRAEMEITLSAQRGEEHFEKTYSLTAHRNDPGYFKFILPATNPKGMGIEGLAIQILTLVSGYGGKFYQDLEIPVTVRLYDESGHLVCERQLPISSVMTQAHTERGE